MKSLHQGSPYLLVSPKSVDQSLCLTKSVKTCGQRVMITVQHGQTHSKINRSNLERVNMSHPSFQEKSYVYQKGNLPPLKLPDHLHRSKNYFSMEDHSS